MPGLAHLQSRISFLPHLARVDLSGIRRLAPIPMIFRKRQALALTAMAPSHAYLISSGWAICSRILSDGRRQVINFLIPGDFVGLCAATNAMSDYFVEATTDLSAIAFPAAAVKELFQMPHGVGDVALHCMAQETSIITEHLTNVGQRTAHERLIHMTLELWIRLRQAGLCSSRDFAFPAMHRDIADALALSDGHLSRTVKAVRDKRLVDADFLRRHIVLLDTERALKSCAFDPSYLYAKTLLP